MNSDVFNRGSSGTQRVLNKTNLFIDIDFSLYFMDKDEIIWKFDKLVGKENKSWFRWSTFFSNEEINLDWIDKTKCK